MQKFIYRKEYFGFVKYDVQSMTHSYVEKLNPEDVIDVIDLGDKCINDGLLVSPIRIYIETTLNCNLKCPYCFNIVGQHKDLDTEKMLQMIDVFKRNGVIDLRFTGGEILTRKDWNVILKYAKERGFVFSVNTNGAYNSDKIIQQFVDVRPNQVTFSVDGIGSEHDAIRGKGSFEKMIQNMRTLHNEGLNLRINCVLTTQNYKSLNPILRLAEKYCSEINFFGVRPIGEGEDFDSCLNFKQFSEVSEYLGKLKIDGLNILYGHNVMKDMSVNENPFALIMGSPDFTTRFNVTSNGDFYSGGYLAYIDKNLRLGNVFDSDNSLYDIWHFNKKLKYLREKSSALKKICHSCDQYGSNCNGGIFEIELQNAYRKHITNPYCKYQLNLFDKSDILSTLQIKSGNA